MLQQISPKLLCTVYILLFATITVSAQHTGHLRLTKALKDSLRNEIETMLANDQRYRRMIMYGETDETKLAAIIKQEANEQFKRMKDVSDNKAGISVHVKDSLWQLQSAIDSANFIKMSGIIYKYGFPKKYVAAYKVSAILLHSSPHFMTMDFFNILKEEVINGNMPGIEYATIYDKTRLNNKLPELYYVIEHFDPKTNTSVIGKPRDIEATNRAREEIGLKKIQN